MRQLNRSASGRPQVASPSTARGAGGRADNRFGDPDQDSDESDENAVKQGGYPGLPRTQKRNDPEDELDSDEAQSEEEER